MWQVQRHRCRAIVQMPGWSPAVPGFFNTRFVIPAAALRRSLPESTGGRGPLKTGNRPSKTGRAGERRSVAHGLYRFFLTGRVGNNYITTIIDSYMM